MPGLQLLPFLSYSGKTKRGAYSDILNKLETNVYSLCFKKQTLEILLHLSFKAELSIDGL